MMNQPYFIWDDKKFVKLILSEIMFLKSDDNYLRFMAKDYSYQIRATMDKTLSELPEGLFVRVHRSYAVSLHYLELVDKDLVVVGGEPLPLSKQYYAGLVKKLNILGADAVSKRRKGLR